MDEKEKKESKFYKYSFFHTEKQFILVDDLKKVIDDLTIDCDKDKAIELELDGMIDADELKKKLGLE